MLLELNQLQSGTVFHQDILNQATFFQRVQLRDQDWKGQALWEKTTTLFGTEGPKHKFNILAEMAKTSKDIRLQELEDCQVFKCLLSTEDATALAGLVKGFLKASSASGGRGRTSSAFEAPIQRLPSKRSKNRVSRRSALFLR